MAKPLRNCQSHGGSEDEPRPARYPLGTLEQHLKTRVGQDGLGAACALQAVPDQVGEALPLLDRFDVHAQVQAGGEGCKGRPVEELRQAAMAHEPHRHEIPGIEGEVEEGREVPEELQGEVLRLVDDPDRKDLLAIGELEYPRLDVAPELGTAEGGVKPQGERQLAVDVHASEVGLGHVNHFVAVGIESVGDLA